MTYHDPDTAKPVYSSKTIWAGSIAALMALVVEVWAAIAVDPVALATLRESVDSIFGVRAFGLLGILMIVLRVVTTSPVTMGYFWGRDR